MGNCVSEPIKAPPKALQENNHHGPPELKKESVPHADLHPPVTVFRDGKATAVALRTTRSGRLTFSVIDDVREAAEAARDTLAQLDQGGPESQKQMENLQLLQSMGVQVHYSGSFPFIGQLVLKVLEVSGSANAASTSVKVRCEGDRGKPKAATAKQGEPDRGVFKDAVFIFIILHSNAVVHIKVKDKKSGNRYFGQIEVPVSQITQGAQEVEYHLHAINDPKQEVCTMKAEVEYQWLRGTRDEGAYLGASRIFINKRKMRAFMGAGPKSAVEYISQVNHWLLSHDNIYNPKHEAVENAQQSDEGDDEGSADGELPGIEGAAPNSSAKAGPTQGSLFSRTSTGGAGGNAARWARIVDSAQRDGRLAEQTPTSRMAESTLLEAFGPREGDSEEMRLCKEQMLAVMLSLNSRIDQMAVAQQQQKEAIEYLINSCSDTDKKAALTITEQSAPFISGTFEYGLGRPAGKRKVYLFINKAQDQRALSDATVHFLGVFKTNSKGQLKKVPVPDFVYKTPGHYNIIGLLPEDNTYAKGSLFILEPGTQCVVFDLDGTITVGDIEVVTLFALDSLAGSTAASSSLAHNYDLKARKSALHAVRAWAAKGYQPIYLSGRQGSYYNLTLEWLIKHSYPPGPIHLTRTHMPTLPIYYSVGNFKVEYMEGLKARGLQIFAAYGNTPTDIRAYASVGIPKERTFIVGPAGGKLDTVKVDNFTDHLPEIFKFPDATLPIPYTELLFTANPGYKRRVKDAEGLEHQVSSVSSATVDDISDVAEEDEELDDVLEEDMDAAGAGAAAKVAEKAQEVKDAVLPS
ncbi:hypothetical protein WJX72_007801 [[Myrmecia] bisecta]|uniref:LNS2/PITP domain-containing protein n=1 Tax=[Myrmecia] bisecta TaxID=41462 RepID=A0AAW1QRP5_9CHLO